MKLRPYQETIIESARSRMSRGCKSILITAPTGSGKTVLIAHMVKTAMERGYRSWFVVHRRELIKQSIRTFDEVGVKSSVIAAKASGWKWDDTNLTQVCGIQSLIQRYKKARPPRLIIFDECFVRGTIVDGSPIEDLRVGDSVMAWDEFNSRFVSSRVNRVFCNNAPDRLIRIKTTAGELICTPNHPIMVDRTNQWVVAGKIKKGNFIYALCGLQKAAEKGSESSLFNLLPKKHVRKEPKRCAKENERKQPNEISENQKENGRNPKKDRSSAKGAWRKWTGANNTTKKIGKSIEVANGGLYFLWKWIKKEGASQSLQIRHSKQKISHWYRGRRIFPLCLKKKETRFKEREIPYFVRVEDIEVLKRGSDGEFERVCPDGKVYNLEVDKYHTYTANGLVVHNCHHVAAGTWDKLYSIYPDAVKIGVTATPQRLDGKGLSNYFDQMILGPTVPDLIKEGYLADFKVFAPPGVITEGIKTVMGDYKRSDLAKAANKSKVTGCAIEEYNKHANGKRAVVFCCSVEHSIAVCEQFNSAGISAEHLDGKTSSPCRDKALDRFAGGTTKVLCNVDLFSEGFDLPSLECAILLRPTQSLSLYLQQVGRALRPSPGKDKAIILDHAGNVERHGFPDEKRQWSLNGRVKSSPLRGPRVCPKCYFANEPSLKSCDYCGASLSTPGQSTRNIPKNVKGSLKELRRQESFRKRLENNRATTLEDLISLGRSRGYKFPEQWARKLWLARLGMLKRGS